MAFDLASVLKGAAETTAVPAKESIEYIPLDKIDPDPANFYELSDLDSLAESIELLGLQQPIRVRTGENGHVTVVSGHRRRAAIMMIHDGGNPMFKDGVPCIRELKDGSAALNELKLIYANSASRVLTAAEISKQAERVTELLYQLKEEGIEFPGRMREHVAQACNVSAAKLGRLHAIRENLLEGLLKHFDAGELSEAAAYELQKLPAELQQAICVRAEKGKGKFSIWADSAKNCVSDLGRYTNPVKCKEDGCPCSNMVNKFVRTASVESWHACTSSCCMSCYHRNSCKFRCDHAAEAVEKEKLRSAKEKAASERRAEKQRKANAEALQLEAKKLVPLIDAAGIEDDFSLIGIGKTVKEVRRIANGDLESVNPEYRSTILPLYLDGMKRLCRDLNCTIAYLYGDGTAEAVSKLDTERKKTPGVPEPRWFEGTPSKNGKYIAKVSCGESAVLTSTLFYNDGEWFMFKPSALHGGSIREENKLDKTCTVTGWWPLPED